jgi:Asp-tRNA(Asn)/Glu-tRNA(Gln) amidotransferase C subunit
MESLKLFDYDELIRNPAYPLLHSKKAARAIHDEQLKIYALATVAKINIDAANSEKVKNTIKEILEIFKPSQINPKEVEEVYDKGADHSKQIAKELSELRKNNEPMAEVINRALLEIAVKFLNFSDEDSAFFVMQLIPKDSKVWKLIEIKRDREDETVEFENKLRN